MTLLDIIIAIPALGFILALLIPRNQAQFSRLFTLAVSLVTFVASLGLVTGFDQKATYLLSTYHH